MNTPTKPHPFQPLHRLKAGSCTTIDRMQVLLFLATRNGGSSTQIGHAIGVLPTTAANMLKLMSSADDPLVTKLATIPLASLTGGGFYLLTDAGRDAVRATILLMNQVGHGIHLRSGELDANITH